MKLPDLIRYASMLVVGILVGHYAPRLLRWIRGLSPSRTKIKSYIEKGINQEFRETFRVACGVPVLKAGVKIEWQEVVTAGSATCIDKDGDIVIRLGYANDKNLSRSFTKALMLYLEDAFMPEALPFVGPGPHTGAKYTMAKEVTFSRDADCYRYFVAGYLAPLLSRMPRMEALLEKLETISARRLFRPLLLREMYALCETGKISNQAMRDEVAAFIDFVYNIADKDEYEREHGTEPPLGFPGRFIKVLVVLVRRADAPSLDGHVNSAESALRHRGAKVYVTGWGSRNVEDAKEVARLLSERGHGDCAILHYTVKFVDGTKPGVCCIFEAKPVKRW